MFGCAGVSVAAWVSLQLQRAGDYSLVVVDGFLCCGTQAQGTWASAVAARGFAVPARGLSCPEARGIFPGPGFEPAPPALAGGLFSRSYQGSPQIPLL